MTTSTKITKVNPFANLTWGQRLQIVSDYRVSFKVAAKIMSVDIAQLEQASKDTIADVTFDTSEFSQYFSSSTLPTSSSLDAAAITTAKKRGRKSSKIRDAFNAITTTPQPLYEFCLAHNVSEHCMRQHNRFAPDRTDIVIRKVKGEHTVPMIWSQPTTSTTSEETTQVTVDTTVEVDLNLAANVDASNNIEASV